jgi:hypothetical protein
MSKMLGTALDLPQITTVLLSPAASRQLLYIKADGKLYTKNSAAVETLLGPGEPVIAGGTTAQFWRGDKSWQTLMLSDIPDAWVKRSTKAATTANITLSAAQTVDGIALIAGDRCLVKNQTATAENGIYQVNAGAWTRTADADAGSEIAGATVNVDQGTQGGQTWTTTFKPTDTLGTTAMFWYRMLDASQLGVAGGVAPTIHTHTKANITDFAHTHHVNDLTAVGTKDATTFLRGDNTWSVPVGGGSGPPMPMGKYSSSVAQSAAGSTWTRMVVSDTDWLSGGATRSGDNIMVPTTGRYAIAGYINWSYDSGASGQRRLAGIGRNWSVASPTANIIGSTESSAVPSINVNPGCRFYEEHDLVAGDGICLLGWQNSGGALTTNVATQKTMLSVRQVPTTQITTDVVPVATICTSTTRPAAPYAGQQIFETDTRRYFLYSAGWIQTGVAPCGKVWEANTNQVFTVNQFILLSVPNSAYDTGEFAAAPANGHFTAPYTGLYQVSCSVSWISNSTAAARRILQIEEYTAQALGSGVNQRRFENVPAQVASNVGTSLSYATPLTAGATLRAVVYQTAQSSGYGIDNTTFRSVFSLTRIA